MIAATKTPECLRIEKAISNYWDDFRPEEVAWIHGDPALLCNAITQKYGVSEDEAARQVVEFFRLQHEIEET